MSHTPEPWRAEWQPGQTPNHTYTHCVMCGDDSLCDTLTKADAYRIATLEAELLRVRTTGHGAAHELDNIAVECGLGHSPKPGEVAAHVRQLREAVRVLADECFTANTTITGNAVCHAQIVNCHAGSYRQWTAAQSRTDANPIASAAITDAAKAREGA